MFFVVGLKNEKSIGAIEKDQGRYMLILYRYLKYKNKGDATHASLMIGQFNQLFHNVTGIGSANHPEITKYVKPFLHVKQHLKLGKDGFVHLPLSSFVG